jgi:hypothetical protein
MTSYPQDLSYGVDTRVVLVGTTVCSHDRKNLPPLPHVERNIRSLSRVFTQIVGLPQESIITIIDRDEASAIVNEIAHVAKAASNTLIVYYAGHGLLGNENAPLYLAAKNTTSEDKSYNAIKITDVKSAIRTSTAGTRILILDCCYSGRALEGGMGSTEDDVSAAIDVSGTYGIAAVPGDYKALAPDDAVHTKFTQALLDVLERGVDGAGRVLSLNDVFNAVRAALDREGMPLPQRNNSNEAGNFKIIKNQHLKRLDQQSAQGKAEHREANKEQRRDAVAKIGVPQDEERRTNPSTVKLPTKELKKRLPDKLTYYLFVTWIISILIEWSVAKAMLPRRASFPSIWVFFIDPFMSGYNLGIWSYMVIGTTAVFALSILGVAIASKD